MATCDPREKELDRVCGWSRGQFCEFVLTAERHNWVISVLVDGEIFATAHQSMEVDELNDLMVVGWNLVATFATLVDRLLSKREAA